MDGHHGCMDENARIVPMLVRSYADENWEFDDDGLMRLRLANINDLSIRESERKYHWPLGRRPDKHPGLSDLGF
jgi:uncharacterized protein